MVHKINQKSKNPNSIPTKKETINQSSSKIHQTQNPSPNSSPKTSKTFSALQT